MKVARVAENQNVNSGTLRAKPLLSLASKPPLPPPPRPPAIGSTAPPPASLSGSTCGLMKPMKRLSMNMARPYVTMNQPSSRQTRSA